MMLKYIIKDLKETLAYLPYGIMAGAACQGCLGLSGYRSAPYLAVL